MRWMAGLPYFADGTGVRPGEANAQIVPAFDLNSMKPLDIWCSTEAELLAQVGALADNHQLVIQEFSIGFNSLHFLPTCVLPLPTHILLILRPAEKLNRRQGVSPMGHSVEPRV